MRSTLHATGLLTAVVLLVASAQPALAAPTADAATWQPALITGSGTGVIVVHGAARIDRRTAFLAPSDEATGGAKGAGGRADAVPTGLLTLDTHVLATPTNRISATVDAQLVDGSAATVDVRGVRSSGNWSEWVPAADGTAVLPDASRTVQARLVLSGDPGPTVTAVALGALAPKTEGGSAPGAPLTYRVFATREGLPGGTTANGHVIAPHDHFVALPSRRALSPNGKSDYSVRVCAANGRCAFAPVWDVGPWNTHDDYWNSASMRQQWSDLPQGTPQAQAAFRDGYNGGKDQYDRHVVNPAGIDLADGTFWDDLGLVDNATVTVDYLWTGDVRLAKVVNTGPVLASPKANADVVGVAASNAGVPVECTAGAWLRIGTGQYLPAAMVPNAGKLGPC